MWNHAEPGKVVKFCQIWWRRWQDSARSHWCHALPRWLTLRRFQKRLLPQRPHLRRPLRRRCLALQRVAHLHPPRRGNQWHQEHQALPLELPAPAWRLHPGQLCRPQSLISEVSSNFKLKRSHIISFNSKSSVIFGIEPWRLVSSNLKPAVGAR